MTDNTDLIKAYEFVATKDQFLPSDIADHFGHNMRYSREIIGVLLEKKLTYLDSSGDMDYYKPTLPKDIATLREFGLKRLGLKEDAVRQPKPAKATKATKSAKPPANGKDFHPCLCGCGENVPPKSNYRPGHDARHAGVIARAVAETGDTGLYGDLGSDLLREKSTAMAARIVAKAGKKAIKSGKAPTLKPADVRTVDPGNDGTEETEDGTVKVGKNEYAAVRYLMTGKVEYFDGAETKVASKTAAKSFRVG